MLNKRIKDKIEDIDRLTKELDSDARRKVELEDDVEVCEKKVVQFIGSSPKLIRMLILFSRYFTEDVWRS